VWSILWLLVVEVEVDLKVILVLVLEEEVLGG
jgi:hypothetical protein